MATELDDDHGRVIVGDPFFQLIVPLLLINPSDAAASDNAFVFPVTV